MRTALLLFLSACNGAASPGQTAANADSAATRLDTEPGWDTASPWTLHDPALDATTVAAHIDEVLATGLPDSPALLASFDALLQIGDPGVCGGGSRNMQFPMAGCQTSSGWVLGGLLLYTDLDTLGSYTAGGDAWGVDPEGERWIAAGQLDYTTDASGAWRFEVAGTWGYSGDAGWPGEQPSLAMILEATEDATFLDGGYQPAEEAVYFNALTRGEGMAGEVWLRDPAGDWYVLTPGEDGCGPVTWGSEALGEGCVAIDTAIDALRLRATP